MLSRKKIKQEKGCKNLTEYFQTIIDRNILGEDIHKDLVELSKPQKVRFISWAGTELHTDKSNESEKSYRTCIKICESILKN